MHVLKEERVVDGLDLLFSKLMRTGSFGDKGIYTKHFSNDDRNNMRIFIFTQLRFIQRKLLKVLYQFSLLRWEKPICAPPRLRSFPSVAFETVPMFQCSSD